LQVLYDWAEKGSKLFICDNNISQLKEEGKRLVDFYGSIGQPIYIRAKDKVEKLVGPWRISDPGFKPLEEWVEMDKKVDQEQWDVWGGGLIGGILEKK
jgi:hypothetical protein